jgi:hypothetical protein
LPPEASWSCTFMRPSCASLSRCASQVLGRGVQAVARDFARCVWQVLCRGAHTGSRCAATLSQQEKNNSADLQRRRVSIIGFICTVVHKVTLATMFLR